MILLLILTIAIIGSIIFMCSWRKHGKPTADDSYIIMILPIFIFFGLWLIVFINMCDVKSYTETQVKRYTVLKERVEDKNLSNYSFPVLNDLYGDVKYMDETIKRNRRCQNNPFTWGMFSDTVGDLELLEPIFNNSYKNSHYTWENFVN